MKLSFSVCLLPLAPSITSALVGPMPPPTWSRLFSSISDLDQDVVSISKGESSAFLGPPPPLDELKAGDSFHPFEDALKITRLAEDVPIFRLQNFLNEPDIYNLVETSLSQGDFETAETRQENVTTHRVKSRVQWIPCHVTATTKFMTDLAATLFLPTEARQRGLVQAENIQVVHYDTDGKFDLHHDGLNRTLTVLTYLNGVAGTWFPYVGAMDEEIPTMQLENQGMLEDREPGRDGLLVAGMQDFSHMAEDGKHLVRVQPGDAIVFYNYENHREYGRILSWKTVHCGLPATEPKWIATNWFQLQQDIDEQ